MHLRSLKRSSSCRVVLSLAAGLLAHGAANAQHGRMPLLITSTNDSSDNSVVAFRLSTGDTPALSLAAIVPTGGKGGASTNAGIVQFAGELGAVANYGSATVSELVRNNDSIGIGKTIHLAPDCEKPDSVALSANHLFVVGSNCAESHQWPAGFLDGSVVTLTDRSAAQIAVGDTWAAVTMSSGSVLQLPLTEDGGVLNGSSNAIALPSDADSVPLGAAFWHNLLGFTPAHSPDSFALVNESKDVFPIAGPTPSFPVNAPCWVAKGPGNVWYTGNSPGQAISIFFTDETGGVFYKSVSLPGSPTDVAMSSDRKWLATIYSTGGQAHVAVFSVDAFGGLHWAATSPEVNIAAFNGLAFSE